MRPLRLTAATAAIFLAYSCTRQLTPSLGRAIKEEHQHLTQAQGQAREHVAKFEAAIAAQPELFRETTEQSQWRDELPRIARDLEDAQRADRELSEDARGQASREDIERAPRLVERERELLRTAVAKAETIDVAAASWIAFKRDQAGRLAQMERRYQDVSKAADFRGVKAAVAEAERDWPAKKEVLEGRLAELEVIPATAEKDWQATGLARVSAQQGTATDAQLVTLIHENQELDSDQKDLETKPNELKQSAAQLYDSWDKVLTDLDESGRDSDRIYRERIKTVRTHTTDVAEKKAETTSSEDWVNVSEPDFHAVENDVGMAIAHKDAGLFDDEAQNTPQPAGFAYIAPESQGSNQYGYWTHPDNGPSVWTWLPQYLILRELLWAHSYRPVVIDDYRGYWAARQSHQTYYGKATPTSRPTYGTQGTFTQTRYAGSRFVQSGSYSGSKYGSHDSPGMFSRSAGSSATPFSRSTPSWASGSAGKRFGSQPGMGSQGQRFGRSSSPFRGGGRAFGRGRR